MCSKFCIETRRIRIKAELNDVKVQNLETYLCLYSLEQTISSQVQVDKIH